MECNDRKNETGATPDESSGRADEPKTCANCGAEIDTREWHPLATRTNDDGNLRVYAFCEEDCRDEWADAGASTTSEGT